MSTLPVKPGDKVAIEHIVGRLHVATSDADVEADIRHRIAASSMVAPAQYELACVKHALKVHHRNRDLFLQVARGI